MNISFKKEIPFLPEPITLKYDELKNSSDNQEPADTVTKKTYCAADAWNINNKKRLVRVYPRRV